MLLRLMPARKVLMSAGSPFALTARLALHAVGAAASMRCPIADRNRSGGAGLLDPDAAIDTPVAADIIAADLSRGELHSSGDTEDR